MQQHYLGAQLRSHDHGLSVVQSENKVVPVFTFWLMAAVDMEL